MSDPLTNEILTVIAAATTNQIGDAAAPANSTMPYAVLYPLPSPTHDGDLFTPDRDRSWVYQVTSVAPTRKGTQWMADQIQTAMEGSTFSPTGLTVMGVETVARGGVERDDGAALVTTPGDTAPLLFYSVDTYEFHTTR